MNASHQPTESLGVVLPPDLCVNGSHATLNLHHRQVCSLICSIHLEFIADVFKLFLTLDVLTFDR
jgi:hypothetical protein